jgi:hypothetical protein
MALGPPVNYQNSYAGVENGVIQTESYDSETSDEQQQSEEQGTSADIPNATSSPDGSTVSSELIANNQTTGSNKTEETSKPRMFNRQLSPDILEDFQILTPPTYKVTVVFDWMKVHESHEGLLSGGGEYDIVAYVQGKKVALTDLSGPGQGLWDVSRGETVTFNPSAEVVVEILPQFPLSIFTVGAEVDGCDRTAFPEIIQDVVLKVLTVGGSLKTIQDELNDAINWAGCKLNPNDVLGVINKDYKVPTYGAGIHYETSDKGDFSLRYTISVTAPPITPQTGQSIR